MNVTSSGIINGIIQPQYGGHGTQFNENGIPTYSLPFTVEDAPQETVSVSECGLNITISDNGKGMSAEETDRLFDRYYRRTNTEGKTEGTGLGLAIAKSIIELHGGTISVTSSPRTGTAFLICFPVCQES